jgi:hypothetical protein
MATPTASTISIARGASGMSTGAKIGAGVGAAVGIVAVLSILLVVFFTLRRRRARDGASGDFSIGQSLRHGKEINLTGKQVLEIDDDSYMRELPCTYSHVTDVALRCLANNTTSSE